MTQGTDLHRLVQLAAQGTIRLLLDGQYGDRGCPEGRSVLCVAKAEYILYGSHGVQGRYDISGYGETMEKAAKDCIGHLRSGLIPLTQRA